MGEAPVAGSTSDRLLVLVVEDNVVNRMVITGYLEVMNCAVMEAENGAVAVDLFKSAQPDFVLMDLDMPVMDGFEAARRIRAVEEAEHRGRTPIIAVTAKADEESRSGCAAAGMDAYLTKPLKANLLLQTLSAWAGITAP